MPTPELTTIDRVLSLPGLSDSLCFSFDILLLPRAETPTWFRAEPEECEIVATAMSGGAYARLAEAHATIYIHVDPRGMAERLATTFPELLRLVVELPYWRELLAASPGGDLEPMQRAARALEREVADDLTQLAAARQDVIESLQLPEIGDPVAYLHRQTRSSLRPRVIAPDGSPCTAFA